MTSVVQAVVVPEPEPEPEPEPSSPAAAKRDDEPKSDSVSFPEPTGVHTQPGGGIRAALTELEECKSQIARRESVKLAFHTLHRCL